MKMDIMNDIPQIVEDLYYELVHVPAPEDRPNYLGGSELAVQGLYAFYSGLRAGFQLSSALREEPFIPSAE